MSDAKLLMISVGLAVLAGIRDMILKLWQPRKRVVVVTLATCMSKDRLAALKSSIELDLRNGNVIVVEGAIQVSELK